MLKCPECIVAAHETLPLHRVEVSPTRGKNHMITHLTIVDSDGTVNFSITTLFTTSDFPIKSATRGGLVLVLSLDLKILSSSIPPVFIASQSSTAIAASVLRQIGPSFCASDGFRPLFHVLKPSSPSTALKHFTNLCYKGKQTYMIITTCFYDGLIMLTFTTQLSVLYFSFLLTESDSLPEPIFRNPPRIPNVAELNGAQASWPRSRTGRDQCYVQRGADCRMPSLSSPWTKSSRWLGKIWGIIVRFFFIFPFHLSLTPTRSDFYILSSSLSTVTSSSKGRNGVSTISNSCLVGAHMFQRRSTRVTLLTTSTKRRFVPFSYIRNS